MVAQVEACVTRATIVKASDEDMAWLYPDRDPTDSALEWTKLGPRLVVLTVGAAGATAYFGAARVSAPALAVEVVDTVGAGDAYMAGLLAALYDDGALGSRHLTPQPDEVAGWLRLAAATAGLCCMRRGADPPMRADVERVLGRQAAAVS